MSRKAGIGFGDRCAAGEPPFNQRAYMLKGDGQCTVCGRWPGLTQKGLVKRHVYQPKETNIDVGDRSTNSQANRAMRAVERMRGNP